MRDLDTFAQQYAPQRGFVLLHLFARGSSLAWHPQHPALTDDLKQVVERYDPTTEYVVVIIAPDPGNPMSQLVQWQRRDYYGHVITA